MIAASPPRRPPRRPLPADVLLQTILAGTAAETGEGFFAALVQQLCQALGTYGAWVTEYLPGSRRLRALAFWLDQDWIPEYEYALQVFDIVSTPVPVQIQLTTE